MRIKTAVSIIDICNYFVFMYFVLEEDQFTVISRVCKLNYNQLYIHNCLWIYRKVQKYTLFKYIIKMNQIEYTLVVGIRYTIIIRHLIKCNTNSFIYTYTQNCFVYFHLCQYLLISEM